MKLIASLLVFYPLIVPIWQEEPLNLKNTALPEKVYFIDKEEVAWQVEQIKKIKDPRIKTRIVFDLSKSNNPETVALLTGLLDKSDENLKTDILLTLYSMRNLPKTSNSSIFEGLMKEKNEQIKAYSYALYLNHSGNPDKVLNLILNNSSPFILNFIRQELLKKSDDCNLALVKKALASENLDLKALAVSIIALRKNDPDKEPELHKIIDSPNIPVRAALAEKLSSRNEGGTELLKKLSGDKSATVRGYVASSEPAEQRLHFTLKLSDDPDFEVRRTAAVALGNYKSPESVNRLIDLLADETYEVRTAAENSIIKIQPGSDLMNRIGKESLKKPISTLSAIRVLGQLEDKRFSGDINKILAETKDDDLIIRSIRALDKLDFKESEKNIRKHANHTHIYIQKAVAHALGTLAKEESFDTIVSLSTLRPITPTTVGRPIEATCEAIKAMGRIGDPFFNDRLNEIIHNMKRPSAMRASAIWSISRINKPTKKMTRQLEEIVLEKVIPVPGAGPMFDTDFTRISACLAFVDMGKTNSEFKKKATELLKTLQSDKTDKFGAPISNRTLKDYARQAELYMQGISDIKPKELPPNNVLLTIKKIQ